MRLLTLPDRTTGAMVGVVQGRRSAPREAPSAHALLRSGPTPPASGERSPRPRRTVPLKLVAAAAAAGLALPIGFGIVDALPDWGSALTPQTVDRSPAPLLTALRD